MDSVDWAGTEGQEDLPGWTRTLCVQPEIVLEIECGLVISLFSSSFLHQTFLLLLNCFALF